MEPDTIPIPEYENISRSKDPRASLFRRPFGTSSNELTKGGTTEYACVHVRACWGIF